jgi:hypothetical protein
VPYPRSSSSGATSTSANLLDVSLAAGRPLARRGQTLREPMRAPASSRTTARFYGARSEPAPTCCAWAVNTRTHGTACT